MRVAGRLVGVGTRLCLADAEATLTLTWACPAPAPAAGQLCDLEGQLSGGRDLRVTAIHASHPGQSRTTGEHERLRSGVGHHLRARARAMACVREFFTEEAFLEVDTPTRVPAPGLDLHVEAIAAGDEFLITSPEHHMKRLLVGGLPRIFQLCHASRAEDTGPLHQPEFLLLEWYRAFSGQEAVIADTERIVQRVAETVIGEPRLTRHGSTISVTPPFERITVREAFRKHAGVDGVELARSNEDQYFQLLVDRVEPALARCPRPIFLCEYPIGQASLARPVPGDPDVAERFELYLAGVELCNGFGELTDAALQRQRYEEALAERKRRGHPTYPLDERFLDGLSEGMPPAGGNALGLDRLIALCADCEDLADVQAFPDHWK